MLPKSESRGQAFVVSRVLIGLVVVVTAAGLAAGGRAAIHAASNNVRLERLQQQRIKAQKITSNLRGRRFDLTNVQRVRTDQIWSGKRPVAMIHGVPSQMDVALTFDDSPLPQTTNEILDILHRENVKATFFCIGKQVEKYPELANRIMDEGHQLGNHSYNHVNLALLWPEQALAEWQACSSAIRKITGLEVAIARPPGGNYTADVIQACANSGMSMIFWTVNPSDFSRTSADAVVRKTIPETGPGGIIMLHDGHETTAEALPRIIHELRSRGYRFVTIDQMMRAKRFEDDFPRLDRRELKLPYPGRPDL